MARDSDRPRSRRAFALTPMTDEQRERLQKAR